MSAIRAVGYELKDQDDNAAFQMLVTDVQRLKQELRIGSDSGAGGTGVGGPGGTGPTPTTTTTGTTDTPVICSAHTPVGLATTYSGTGSDTFVASTLLIDTDAGYNTGSGVYTVPTSGKYLISTVMSCLFTNVVPPTTPFIYVSIYVNASQKTYGGMDNNMTAGTQASLFAVGSIIYQLAAGNQITISVNHTGGIGPNYFWGEFNISRLGA